MDLPAENALRASFEDIVARNASPSDFVRAALRTRVCGAVDELKSMGWPVEKIIVRVKELAHEVGVPERFDPVLANRDGLLDETVRVCIERYYRTDGG